MSQLAFDSPAADSIMRQLTVELSISTLPVSGDDPWEDSNLTATESSAPTSFLLSMALEHSSGFKKLWTVVHRYSVFRTLHKLIKAEVPRFINAEFPPKTFSKGLQFIGMQSSREKLDLRAKMLGIWLREALANYGLFPEVCKRAIFVFLQIPDEINDFITKRSTAILANPVRPTPRPSVPGPTYIATTEGKEITEVKKETVDVPVKKMLHTLIAEKAKHVLRHMMFLLYTSRSKFSLNPEEFSRFLAFSKHINTHTQAETPVYCLVISANLQVIINPIQSLPLQILAGIESHFLFPFLTWTFFILVLMCGFKFSLTLSTWISSILWLAQILIQEYLQKNATILSSLLPLYLPLQLPQNYPNYHLLDDDEKRNLLLKDLHQGADLIPSDKPSKTRAKGVVGDNTRGDSKLVHSGSSNSIGSIGSIGNSNSNSNSGNSNGNSNSNSLVRTDEDVQGSASTSSSSSSSSFESFVFLDEMAQQASKMFYDRRYSHNIMVRGPNYMHDKKKIHAGAAMCKLMLLELYEVKVSKDGDRHDHIARKGLVKKRIEAIRALPGNPLVLLFNFQIPGDPPVSILTYFAVPPSLKDSDDPDVKKFYAMLLQYMNVPRTERERMAAWGVNTTCATTQGTSEGKERGEGGIHGEERGKESKDVHEGEGEGEEGGRGHDGTSKSVSGDHTPSTQKHTHNHTLSPSSSSSSSSSSPSHSLSWMSMPRDIIWPTASDPGALPQSHFCNRKFKLIPMITEGPWVVQAVVPSNKPTLLGSKVVMRYFAGDGYMETDVNIGSSAIALQIIGVCRGYGKHFAADLGILFEGDNGEELPEKLLGCASFHKIDMDIRQRFDEDKEG